MKRWKAISALSKKTVLNHQNIYCALSGKRNSTFQTLGTIARGNNPDYVFVYKNKPINRMLTSGWNGARRRSGLPDVRAHGLKHTFGSRLRTPNVSFEDRQDLLGHKSHRITTHYSAAEIGNLLKAANMVCNGHSGPLLILVKSPTNLANSVVRYAA